MRTTVTLDDELYAQARVRAALDGRAVGSVIEEALRLYLVQASMAKDLELPALPTFDGGGLMPGVDLDDMSSVYDVLDEGRPLDELR